MALRVHLIVVWFVFLSAKLWVITESVERCKQYPNPKNGRMVCDSLFRLFCAPECDEGFTAEFKPAVVYMCGPLTGEWFTYPEGEKIPWPDCVRQDSSKSNNVEDEVSARRAQITQKIHQTHQGMFLNSHPMKPAQLTEHPNARYLHLFDYIQRAQQIYNDKQTSSIGYNALEKQRLLDLQQQKQKQLETLQQVQRRQNLIGQQESELRKRHFQREMMEKLRQQRETIYTSPITNNYQQVVTPKSARWRNPAYQNSQKNLQSNAKVDSRFLSPAQAVSWGSHYSKTPQPIHERFSTSRALQEKTRSNVAKGDFHQQLSNSEVRANSVGLTKQNVVLKSSLQNSQMEKKLTLMKEQMGPVTVSQPVMSTWQRPDFNRVLPSSQRNATPLTSQPVQRNQSNVHVSSQLISNQIGSPGDNVNPTTQSQFRISSSNQLEEGNQSIVLPKNESSQLIAQSVKGQVNQFSVKVAGSVFQTNNDGPPSVKSKDESNRTSQTQRRGGVGDGPEPQEKPQKKEKLFYFPIKRDTLIRLLPSNLQEEFRSLRETRNINSTYETSIDKEKAKSKFLEDMKVQQNVAQKMDSSANISNYKYSIEQIKTGNNSITEYFDLLPQSSRKSPYQSEEAIKSNNTIVP